uniref:Uncharacterized protein n=1 Tax=Scleropages formosus TaxID=113540 RepID=A0A8C9SDF9_SCLFO
MPFISCPKETGMLQAEIKTRRTRDANNQGHLEMAKRNSRLARNLNHAGLGIGIAIFVLWIIFVLFLSAK